MPSGEVSAPLQVHWMMRRSSEDRRRGAPALRSAGFVAVISFFERSPIQPLIHKSGEHRHFC